MVKQIHKGNLAWFLAGTATVALLVGIAPRAASATAVGGSTDCSAGDSSCTTTGNATAPSGSPGTGANIGNTSGGTLTITGGTWYAQPLDVGVQSDVTGTVMQSGGTLNDDAVIGDAGSGSYTNSNATHNVSGNLILGNQSSGNGTYTITGNNAQTNITFSGTDNPDGALIVGNQGTGTFNQGTDSTDNGNQVNAAGAVVLGSQAGSSGAYNLNSGTLTIQTGNGGNPGFFNVGDAGVGTFTQTGGAVIAGQQAGSGYAGNSSDPSNPNNNSLFNMNIGNQANTAGSGGSTAPSSYTLTSTDQTNNPASLTVNGNLNLGVGVGAQGNFTIGTFSASPDPTSLTVNFDSWNNGQNSTPQNGGNILIGVNVAGSTASSTFTQNNGNVTAANDVAIGINSGPGIGGVYDMSGGTLTTPNLEVGGSRIFSTPGNGGAGIFTQSGGVVTIGSWFGGQILANGTTTPGGTMPSTEGTGVLGTLTLGANGGNGLYELGTGDIGGVALQTNTTQWGGYPDTPFTNPPSFDNVNNAPYLQIYGNAVVGADPGGGTSTFLLAGDGTHLQINNVVGLSNQGNLIIGQSGSGDFQQTDQSSAYLDGSVALGVNDGANGTYELTAGQNGAGTLSVGGDLEIGGTDHVGDPIAQNGGGYGGTGTFTQSAGGVTVQGNLTLGLNGDGTGSTTRAYGEYDLSGGTLTVNNVGSFGNNGATGVFNQTGGTAQFGTSTNSGGLELGTNPLSAPASSGTYTITGSSSTLNVYGDADVGVSPNSTGTLTIGNGSDSPTVNVLSTGGGDGNLTIGDAGNGNLNIHSGTLGVDNATQIGVNGIGTVTQDGGTFNTGFLDLSVPAGSGSSTYTMTGGALNVANFASVGGQSTGTAVFNLGGTGVMTVGTSGGGDLGIGTGTGGTGTFNYNVNADDTGSLVFAGSGQNLVVGDAGTGTFNEGSATNMTDLNLQTSGTTLDIGRSSGGTGTFNLAAGSTLEDDMIVGDAGTGTMNNAGGTQTVGTTSAPENLILGNQSTGNGTYNLTAGGTLNVTNFTFVGAAGTGTFLNDGSTHNTQVLVLGEVGGSKGTYTLKNGGALTVGTPSNTGFFDIGEHGTGTFNQSGGTTTVNGALDLGRCGDATGCLGTGDTDTTVGSGTVNLTGGTMSVTQFAVIGDSGTGVFNQDGNSTVTVTNEVDVGRNGGTGTYNLGGGIPGLSVADNPADASSLTITKGDLTVGSFGPGGSGTFNQSDATTVGIQAGNVVIGDSSGVTGNYNLSGTGGLTVSGDGISTGVLYVGAAGTGGFSQSGTSTVSAANVTIGNDSGGTGTYTLTGGTLTDSSTLYVGAAGSGDLNQSGGTITATGLVLGNNSGGSGTYELSGGQVTISGDALLGGDTSTSGTVTQTGGTAGVTGNLVLGNAAGSEGQYTLRGTGALTVGGNLDIAAAAGTSSPSSLPASSGSFYFNYDSSTGTNGGSATLSFSTPGSQLLVGDAGTGSFTQGGGDLNLTAQNVTLDIGVQQNSHGEYDLKGGTLEDDLVVGDAGSGVFDNSGGTHTVSGNLIVGNQSTGVGTYTLGGNGNLTLSDNNAQIILGNAAGANGTFNFNTTSPSDSGTVTFGGTGQSIVVGLNGTGNFNQGGGDLNLNGAGVGLDIAQNDGSIGHGTLTGGTLETGALNVGDAGTGTFTTSGGTHTVNGNLVVGNQATGVGTYTLGGTGNLTLAGTNAQIILGNAAGARGTFNYNTGVGDNATFTSSGTGQQIIVGNSGTGTLNQDGGDLNLNSAGVALDIAQNSGSNGTYSLNGGSLETSGGLNVGDGGQGGFTQEGGTATINGNLVLGNQTGSLGEVTLIGAGSPSLTVTGDATVGNNGQGSLAEDAGTIDIKGSMTIGATAAGGSATINAGSLTVGDGVGVHTLTIDANGSMSIGDDGGSPVTAGAQVTVDGMLVNNNTLEIGIHDATPPSTLTVTNGLQNNSGALLNAEGNAVVNANVTNAGEFTAQNGVTTNVTLNGNMDNSGTVNVSPLGAGTAASTLTENGTFTNESTGTFQVTGSNATINGQSGGDSLDNSGTVTVANNVNSTTGFHASTVKLNNNVVNNGGATMTVQGSNVTVTGTAGSASPALNNAGTLNIQTGANNQGSSFTVNGNTTNTGTVQLTNSTATWNGTFTNNGAYKSDPSTSNFVNFDIGANGYVTGGSGDLFKVAGDLLNSSTQNTLWNTAQAELEFTTGMSTTSHTFDLAGADMFTSGSGFTNNFAWGTVGLDSGNTVSLEGLGGLTTGPYALYVGDLLGLTFSGDTVTDIFGDGFNIYYDPTQDAALGDLAYNLENGGFLCPIGASSCTPTTGGGGGTPVPEPASLLLLAPWAAGLAFWRRRRRGDRAE